MNQMKNSVVPAKRVTTLSCLSGGFFRIKNDSGKIFYANGELVFPVLTDGSLHRVTAHIDPGQEVEVIEKDDLGINKVRYYDYNSGKKPTF
jgi:hypothetical protein